MDAWKSMAVRELLVIQDGQSVVGKGQSMGDKIGEMGEDEEGANLTLTPAADGPHGPLTSIAVSPSSTTKENHMHMAWDTGT